MIFLEKIDTRGGDGRSESASSPTKLSVDLQADTVIARADLIDQIFDFAFDVLCIAHIELRVREHPCGT